MSTWPIWRARHLYISHVRRVTNRSLRDCCLQGHIPIFKTSQTGILLYTSWLRLTLPRRLTPYLGLLGSILSKLATTKVTSSLTSSDSLEIRVIWAVRAGFLPTWWILKCSQMMTPKTSMASEHLWSRFYSPLLKNPSRPWTTTDRCHTSWSPTLRSGVC